MDNRQNKDFSNYLYERANSLLKHLRETNATYQDYLQEIVALSREFENVQHDAEQIRSFLARYVELKDLVGDIENVYLFTKGFAEYKRVEEYIVKEDVIADIFFSE